MANTTFEAIRDEELTLLEALTPSMLGDVQFRRHLEEVPLRDWADQNPQSCFRRITIRDTFDYSTNGSINGNVPMSGIKEVQVAYPNDRRYGPDGIRDMREVMRVDRRDIETTIGERGYSNLTNHTNVGNGQIDIEPGPAATLMIITHRFEFWQDEP